MGNYALMLAEHLGVNLLDVCRDKLVEFEARPEWEQLRRMRVTVSHAERDPLNAAAKALAQARRRTEEANRGNAAWFGPAPALTEESIAQMFGDVP